MKTIKIILSVIVLATITSCSSIIKPSLPSIQNHNACFLVANGSIRMMNILSPILPYENFKTYVQQQKSLGANFCYLYTINEKDGGCTPYSFYVNNDIGGTINEAVIKDYQNRLQYILDQKMGIIIWLRADDSPKFNKTPYAKQVQYQKDVVKYFDQYVSAYVIALEADEYMDAATANAYATELQNITEKPIGVHQTSGQYSYALQNGFDNLYFQYGFGRSSSQILNDTKKIIGIMGSKPVYAAEYHLSSETEQAKSLGDAAISGGAKGTGNNRHQ